MDDLTEILGQTLLRVKVVVETEHGNEIMTLYAPRLVRWGDTVEFKLALEATVG